MHEVAKNINFITWKTHVKMLFIFLYPGLDALNSSFNVINKLCVTSLSSVMDMVWF